MPNFDTQLFSEGVEVLGKIDPASYNAAQNSGFLSAANHRRLVALIQIGAIAATGTVDARLQMATNAGGAGVIDITGKAITQLADSADNKVLLIELKSDELPEIYTHIRLLVTPATAATILGAVVLGLEPRYMPVPLTNVQQVVV